MAVIEFNASNQWGSGVWSFTLVTELGDASGIPIRKAVARHSFPLEGYDPPQSGPLLIGRPRKSVPSGFTSPFTGTKFVWPTP